ncbi:TetR/AcrR family transcriptional regulator [Anaerosporobacter faecicola]|uniref:TetR/AcrR family transcriptional regulator n=1 Tax=Anaerosporobacter faecicola TaxID=2718714 RepID=UPI00143AEF02|nr:TetR/AcrR family transcriptional regulator [Anaerosporobacter faecicola]
MPTKGEQTRSYIKEKAYDLFAENGFNAVTMKDICEKTGLSRGGLYRHYGSTKEIFCEIFEDLNQKDSFQVEELIKKGHSAEEILSGLLQQLYEEMNCPEKSLSYAIYEYANTVDFAFFGEKNAIGREKWIRLLQYGIETKAFPEVAVEELVDVILYSYQGVRMWSRVQPLDTKIADHIVQHIRRILTKS